jgi:AraC-like DNA-binding protein
VEFNQLKVIERESCAHLPQATYIARAAMEFISKNAQRAMKVDDVVRHLGVSRRLADRQFRQTHGESILEAITRHRLAEVSKRLLISRLPVAKVAALCGFEDLAYLGKIFRRRFGCTMSEWRIRSASPCDSR